MKYLGGKFRIQKVLGEYFKSIRKPKQVFLDPFCGAAYVVANVDGVRVASDIHADLIMMWKALLSGWEPPDEVSEDLYKELQHSNSSALRGFVGFGCSFGGKWFGGYAREAKKISEDSSELKCRNFAMNAKRSLLQMLPYMKDVVFDCVDYKEYNPEGVLIYCDPPYENTTKFNGTPAFDYTVFWNTMREWSKTNNVYISSFVAPDDFDCVLEIPGKIDLLDKNKKMKSKIEKLFNFKYGLK